MVAGTFSPLVKSIIKKSAEDQGLERSATAAMAGLARLACGSKEFGSGGGGGTSICGAGSVCVGAAGRECANHRTAKKRMIPKATSPAIKGSSGFVRRRRGGPAVTPGMLGMSALKRVAEVSSFICGPMHEQIQRHSERVSE
jgi:hypothetical protein